MNVAVQTEFKADRKEPLGTLIRRVADAFQQNGLTPEITASFSDGAAGTTSAVARALKKHPHLARFERSDAPPRGVPFPAIRRLSGDPPNTFELADVLLLADGVPRIKAGMFARATLSVGQIADALLVPKDAIVLGGPTPMVFVVDAAGKGGLAKARPVSVQLGAAWEGYLQVKGELKAGESVVVQGNERLRPGQDVVIVREQAGPELKTAAKAN